MLNIALAVNIMRLMVTLAGTSLFPWAKALDSKTMTAESSISVAPLSTTNAIAQVSRRASLTTFYTTGG